MSVQVHNGWLEGTLPDHAGQDIPITKWPRPDKPSPGPVVLNPPNACLHTTEGGPILGERYKTWDYPPNFACGDFKIVQLYPLGMASHAVDTKDGFLLQIELAWRVGGKPVSNVYLPDPSTLNPLVALAAWLHTGGYVTTFLARPNATWPVALDKGPQASADYYRRNDGTWPRPGVYGHVEIPDDEHYDPGSFDYPRFFDLVRSVVDDGGDEMSTDDYIRGQNLAEDKAVEVGFADIGAAPATWTTHRKAGWNHVRWEVNRLRVPASPDPLALQRGDTVQLT